MNTMMRSSKYFLLIHLFLIVSGGSLLSSCSSSTDPFKSYVGKEIVYPPKPDSISGYGGINNTVLFIAKPKGSRVKKVGVWWRNETDSVKAEFSSENDILKVKIDSLDPGNYTFNIYNYDDSGNKSIKTTYTTKVLGENFQAKLKLQKINYALYYNNKLIIYWGGFEETQLVGQRSMIYYVNTSGEEDSLNINPRENRTVIDNYDVNSNDKKIGYSTTYSLSKLTNDEVTTEKVKSNIEAITPETDIVAKIVQNDDNPKWLIPDATVNSGIKPYNDRDYTFDQVKPYNGLQLLRVSNDSKTWQTTSIDTNPLALIFIRNDIQKKITFYVAVDTRLSQYTDYEWVKNENFKKTNNQITLNTDITFNIWKKTYQPGDIVYLGGTGTSHTDNFIYFYKKGI